MGYPMTWRRVIQRNGLTGGYDGTAGSDDAVSAPQWMSMDLVLFNGRPRDPVRSDRVNALAGDLRRLETDSRDNYHVERYARKAGVTAEQARAVLDAFFAEP